jgi:hypothetical protein
LPYAFTRGTNAEEEVKKPEGKPEGKGDREDRRQNTGVQELQNSGSPNFVF